MLVVLDVVHCIDHGVVLILLLLLLLLLLLVLVVVWRKGLQEGIIAGSGVNADVIIAAVFVGSLSGVVAVIIKKSKDVKPGISIVGAIGVTGGKTLNGEFGLSGIICGTHGYSGKFCVACVFVRRKYFF